MKSAIITTLIICSLLITACGSGMIGLFYSKKYESLVMDHHIFIIENGCEYEIEVFDYHEPNAKCDNYDTIEHVFYKELIVEKTCGNWSESIILKNGYTKVVAQSLHDEYLKLFCGE